MRTFFYTRVSTADQTTDNQLTAFERLGYVVDPDKPDRLVSEVASGSTKALERELFKSLIEQKLEKGDKLVVLKLDRLGRDNIDVQQTVKYILEKGIILVCHDLPTPDLSSPEGKLMLQLMSTFAEFERNKIIERTKQGLERAKSQGKKLGRKAGSKHTDDVQRLKAEGKGQSEIARLLDVSRHTVIRNWN
ncbi:recombinase family protein [Vibrio cyclitrophicus]|uniref:recombinase family protein n=1 Tax=Vibrio cyclitrophicus TaxID=47951 RepID=UPI000C816EBC|nr:recombinase family protein [Vibrio cyclitrophicus]PMF23801.1 resolvase [Vibrio cyclitrophicus]